MNVVTAQLADARFGGGHMNGWGGGWMWFGGVAMMLFFAVLIVWLVRVGSGSGGASVAPGAVQRNPSDRGLEILAERYARGELTTEEYRERLNEMQ